jgi:hypothetical protein
MLLTDLLSVLSPVDLMVTGRKGTLKYGLCCVSIHNVVILKVTALLLVSSLTLYSLFHLQFECRFELSETGCHARNWV